ncbi:MAG: DUF6599 family protein [Candidatus Aminicenantales bacterium]|jgi:hypothetical protein
MRTRLFLPAFFLILPLAAGGGPSRPAALPGPTALDLLPRVGGWKNTEEPKRFGPDSLFEYIDGAAEAFINYDFVELALGEYQQPGRPGTMTVEIYDMGTPRNAFGIYSTERYPESRFLSIGTQGYIEEGTLNFLAARYYVKMMAYETGARTEAILESYAADILKKIGEPGRFPDTLKAFPRHGLVANSEKYILKNFLGREFLKNGTLASYKLDGAEPDAFIVEASSGAEAAELLKNYLDAARAKSPPIQAGQGLIRIMDPYLANVFVGLSGRFLYGVTKIKDPALAVGEKLARDLGAALSSESKRP